MNAAGQPWSNTAEVAAGILVSQVRNSHRVGLW
jgi:hypothetical protein